MPTIHTVYLPPAIDFSNAPSALPLSFRRAGPPRAYESLQPRRRLGDSLLGDLLLPGSLARRTDKRKADAESSAGEKGDGDGSQQRLDDGEIDVTATWSGEQGKVLGHDSCTSRGRSRRLHPDESRGMSTPF